MHKVVIKGNYYGRTRTLPDLNDYLHECARHPQMGAKMKRDYQMIPCEDCPVLWARFYELDTNRPFFSDRDGIKKYDISEIGHERRNGYSWYNKDGSKVLAKYEKWKKELNRK